MDRSRAFLKRVSKTSSALAHRLQFSIHCHHHSEDDIAQPYDAAKVQSDLVALDSRIMN